MDGLALDWQAGDMNIPSLMLRRTDPVRNMARYYALSIEPTLFGDIALVRRWGRIGAHGMQKIEIHYSRRVAFAAFRKLVVAKLRRGYRVVGLRGSD